MSQINETLGDLLAAVYQIFILFSRVVIQLFSSHCGTSENEAVDILGEEGGRLTQTDTSMTYEEAVPVVKIIWRKLMPTTKLVENYN